VKKRSVAARVRELHSQLQALFPAPLPTILTITSKLKNTCGECEIVKRYGKKHLLIKLESGQLLNPTFDVLMHEYAHAMDYKPEGFGEDPHGPHWGIHMSKLYTWWDEAPR